MNETGHVVPDDLLYSADHQWVRLERRGDVLIARTGVTDYAQDTLGAVQFVALPSVGTAVQPAEPCGEAEASKAVTDLYAPVGGTVLAINERLRDEPSLLNADPYGDGWLYDIELSVTDQSALPLIAAAPYRELVP